VGGEGWVKTSYGGRCWLKTSEYRHIGGGKGVWGQSFQRFFQWK